MSNRLFPAGLVLTLAMLAACGTWAAPAASTKPVGADLAACRTAADQPICLLKLVARTTSHTPFAANIEIAYSPKVLTAIGPDSSSFLTMSLLKRLNLPGEAASQALVADLAGAAPQMALAPVLAISAENIPDPTDQVAKDTFATRQRILAFEMLWEAAHGERPLPVAHRPSKALLLAALAQWRLDLPKAGSDGDPEMLAQALRDLGEAEQAQSVFISLKSPNGFERLTALIDQGRLDEAVKLIASPMDKGDPAPGLTRSIGTGMLMQKAAETRRDDIVLKLAKGDIDAWLVYAAAPDLAAPLGAPLVADLPRDLMAVATLGSRAEAIRWTERVDDSTRSAKPAMAMVSATAAARAWNQLGQPARANALLALWPRPTEADITACLTVLFDKRPAECAKDPGLIVELSLKDNPIGTPWDELSALGGATMKARRRGERGMAGVEADLAKAATEDDRYRVLQHCAQDGPDYMQPAIAADCARRLAAEPVPTGPVLPTHFLSYGQRKLSAAVAAARFAAQSGELKIAHDMLDLAFDLSVKVVDEPLDRTVDLQAVAIAELREQGRL